MGHILFRLWVVATVIWTALCLWAAMFDRLDRVLVYLQAAFVPAALVLLLGLALRWAFTGKTR